MAWRRSRIAARASRGDSTSAWSTSPSTHDPNAPGLENGTSMSIQPRFPRRTTRSLPSSRSTITARSFEMRTRAVTASSSPTTPKCLASLGNAARGSKPAGRRERAVVAADPDVALDAVDAVRALLVVAVVAPEHVPEAVAQEQSVGVDVARSVVIAERDRRPARRRVAEHGQRRELGHVGGDREAGIDPLATELPERLLAGGDARARPERTAANAICRARVSSGSRSRPVRS